MFIELASVFRLCQNPCLGIPESIFGVGVGAQNLKRCLNLSKIQNFRQSLQQAILHKTALTIHLWTDKLKLKTDRATSRMIQEKKYRKQFKCYFRIC